MPGGSWQCLRKGTGMPDTPAVGNFQHCMLLAVFTCVTRVVLCAAACRMEPEHGRSRVFAQWLNTEDDIQAAVGEQAGLRTSLLAALAP